MPLYNFVADKKGQTSVSNGKVKEEPVSLNFHHQIFFTPPQFGHQAGL